MLASAYARTCAQYDVRHWSHACDVFFPHSANLFHIEKAKPVLLELRLEARSRAPFALARVHALSHSQARRLADSQSRVYPQARTLAELQPKLTRVRAHHSRSRVSTRSSTRRLAGSQSCVYPQARRRAETQQRTCGSFTARRLLSSASRAASARTTAAAAPTPWPRRPRVAAGRAGRARAACLPPTRWPSAVTRCSQPVGGSPLHDAAGSLGMKSRIGWPALVSVLLFFCFFHYLQTTFSRLAE